MSESGFCIIIVEIIVNFSGRAKTSKLWQMRLGELTRQNKVVRPPWKYQPVAVEEGACVEHTR